MVSPWSVKPIMDVFVQRTIEHGLWKFFRQQTDIVINQRSYAQNSSNASQEHSPEITNSHSAVIEQIFSSITMHELGFMFGIYLFGNILAIFAFFCEITLQWFRKISLARKHLKFHKNQRMKIIQRLDKGCNKHIKQQHTNQNTTVRQRVTQSRMFAK